MFIFTKEFWIEAADRAIRTIAQTILAMVGTAVVMSDVNWKYTISATILAGLLSVATSIATRPDKKKIATGDDLNG